MVTVDMGAIAIGGDVQRGAAGVGWWAMSGVGWRRCNINASGGVIPKISHNLEPCGGARNGGGDVRHGAVAVLAEGAEMEYCK